MRMVVQAKYIFESEKVKGQLVWNFPYVEFLPKKWGYDPLKIAVNDALFCEYNMKEDTFLDDTIKFSGNRLTIHTSEKLYVFEIRILQGMDAKFWADMIERAKIDGKDPSDFPLVMGKDKSMTSKLGAPNGNETSYANSAWGLPKGKSWNSEDQG